MARPGPNPKPGAVRRNEATFSWTEVPNTPHTGTPPVRPPSRRVVVVDDKSKQVGLLAATKAWWRVISAMPHCRLWLESDWLFAAETAVIVDDFYRGDTRLAPEIRQRERAMGTTVDARMALRIRYVGPAGDDIAASSSTATPREPAKVARLDDRRRRLTE